MAIGRLGWLASVGIVALLSGCVERRFLVETNPPGAMVFVNNKPYGPSPATVPFIYYGTYQITLVLDGYQTQIIRQKIDAPFYSYPPIDLLAENLYPFKISDRPIFHYDMLPATQPNLDGLRIRGDEVRRDGQSLPEPTKPYNQNPPPPPPGSPWRAPANPTETLPPPTEAPRPGGNVLPPPAGASPPGRNVLPPPTGAQPPLGLPPAPPQPGGIQPPPVGSPPPAPPPSPSTQPPPTGTPPTAPPQPGGTQPPPVGSPPPAPPPPPSTQPPPTGTPPTGAQSSPLGAPPAVEPPPIGFPPPSPNP